MARTKKTAMKSTGDRRMPKTSSPTREVTRGDLPPARKRIKVHNEPHDEANVLHNTVNRDQHNFSSGKKRAPPAVQKEYQASQQKLETLKKRLSARDNATEGLEKQFAKPSAGTETVDSIGAMEEKGEAPLKRDVGAAAVQATMERQVFFE